MKTSLFFAAFFASTMLFAQDFSLPTKDNSIRFSNVVITDIKAPDSIMAKLDEWISSNEKQLSLVRQNNDAIGNLLSLKGKLSIDPDKRNQHNVECEFIMDITYIDGRYRYDVYDFTFLKADQRFDASKVYNGYKKGDPLVKTALETKESALERHQYLLEKLQNNVNSMIQSLQDAVKE
jgi:hypothetical protein